MSSLNLAAFRSLLICANLKSRRENYSLWSLQVVKRVALIA